jgi:tetratricopeptide (TPR) repeat protein
MKESLEEYPRQFEMALLLGTTQLQLGYADQVLKTLLPWTKTWPEDVELNYTVGQALLQTGEEAQATGYLTRAETGRDLLKQLDGIIQEAQQRPQDATPRQKAGNLLMRLKNRQEGRFWLESALQQDPDNLVVHGDLQRYYETTGDSVRARFHRQRIEEIQKPR